jgi:glycosyltransferase involved in cell wall biosynthesis
MIPRISIITPSYNQGQFINRTIQSVMSQNVPDLEYIIMDGKSSDNTLDILRNYDGRLMWISEKDRGQADAVNKGILMSRGEIIGWLNSDDIYYPGALPFVLRFFEKHPEIDVVYGDADIIDVEDMVIEPYSTEDWDYERLKEVCFICQPAVFFRRKVVEKAGMLDGSLQYCMDYEFWFRLGSITPFVKINKRLAGSRMYPENKTMGARVAVHREVNNMFQTRQKTVPPKWIFAYAHAVVEQKEHNRLNSLENLVFVMKLIKVTIAAGFRWKPSSYSKLIMTLTDWGWGAFKNLFKRCVDYLRR